MRFSYGYRPESPVGAPLSRREEGGRRTRTVFLFLGAIAIFGWLYVLFGSDVLVVRKIEINGLKSMDPIDASREVYAVLDEREGWRPWSPRHSWFIDEKKLAENLEIRLFAAHVSVDNLSRNILRLSIEERANRLVLFSEQQYLWVDLQGVATEELKPADKKNILSRLAGSYAPLATDPPLIHKNLDEPIAPGFRVADSQAVKTWIKQASKLVDAGIKYREIRLQQSPTSTLATVISPEGYPILMDLSEDLDPQIKTYTAFRKAQKKPLDVKEYVDVRIPGRVYVK